MVKHQEEHLDRVFQALADRTRRAILLRIAEREHTVSELAEPFQMSLAAVSKHLKVLESAGLLKKTVDGRVHHCKLDPQPLREATDVIRQYQAFWEGQLDSLQEFLERASGENDKQKKE